MRIAYVVFGLTSIVFGTLKFTEGDATGLIQLTVGVGWLMIAAFKRRSASHSKSERGIA
jgi:positive regulator of sigma E activity